MRVEDYYRIGQRGWARVTIDSRERHLMMSPELASYIDQYLAAAGLEKEPGTLLFRPVLHGHVLSRGLSRSEVIGILRAYQRDEALRATRRRKSI